MKRSIFLALPGFILAIVLFVGCSFDDNSAKYVTTANNDELAGL
jgi:hypothetical protein